MTNKLKYFIGNWKMFGDFVDFKIIHRINQFSYKSKNLYYNECQPFVIEPTLVTLPPTGSN